MIRASEKGKAGGKQLGRKSPPCFHQVVGTFSKISGAFAQSDGTVNVVVSGKYAVGMELIFLRLMREKLSRRRLDTTGRQRGWLSHRSTVTRRRLTNCSWPSRHTLWYEEVSKPCQKTIRFLIRLDRLLAWSSAYLMILIGGSTEDGVFVPV